MSAIIRFNSEKIEICANLYIYGTYASTDIAEKISEEINHLWNQPIVVYRLKEKYFKVAFNVSVSNISTEECKIMIAENSLFENNFIRVEEKSILERSMMGHGLGGNCGHWIISDNLGSSTTAAHEFGHALGLPHPEKLDYRGEGSPPIMAPRGTIVDSEFQWDKSARVGEYGGTMNPQHRKVKDYEVQDILNRALSRGTQNIGMLTNVLFDEIGRKAISNLT